MPSYAPGEVSAIHGTHIVTGYAPGTMINAARRSEAATLTVGVQGDWCFNLSSDKSGLVTFTLLGSSPSNDYFMGIALAQEKLGAGEAPLGVEDANGTSLHFAESTRLQKISDKAYEAETGNVQWAFLCPVLDHYVGSNV